MTETTLRTGDCKRWCKESVFPRAPNRSTSVLTTCLISSQVDVALNMSGILFDDGTGGFTEFDSWDWDWSAPSLAFCFFILSNSSGRDSGRNFLKSRNISQATNLRFATTVPLLVDELHPLVTILTRTTHSWVHTHTHTNAPEGTQLLSFHWLSSSLSSLQRKDCQLHYKRAAQRTRMETFI